METISRSLLTFLLNSLWQVPLAAAVAAVACRLMRRGPASHRHAVWVAALVASIMLPLASVRRAPGTPGPQFDPSLAVTVANPAAHRTAPVTSPAPAPAPRTVNFAATTASVLMGVYLLFVLFLLGRLAWASIRTVQIRGAARYPAIPERLDRVWMRCQEAFGLNGVELLVSARVSGPVAAGRSIILPESMLTELSEDVLTTAVGHEMAHIARRDFGCNLLYEAILLPIGFHPAAWLMRREIERTREMACDELVTERLMDAGVYARSIMSIAHGMMALPRPGYTLGVFDGDILEARIRRLVERPVANLKRARLLLASGLGALVLCAVVASSVALTALAQGGASALMKQAEAAYNAGDFKQATDLFESAVKVEPANLKAKLLLADTLLQQYVPGSAAEADVSLAARARQQYLDVLAVEGGNKTALGGMTMLDLNTKHFTEARNWALKSIQADATNRDAYYTIGFIDWATTYPDYAAARMAAGMKPQDPGNIPDAGLRQGVRSKHGAEIEEGFRMLQVAIQLDPDYSDAMAYMNLLFRISAGIADTPTQSADYVAKADEWVTQALEAKQRQAQNPRPASGLLDVGGPSIMRVTAPPPPPPPPPPPGAHSGNPAETGQIGVLSNGPTLVLQERPVYPAAARQAGVSGMVRLRAVIGKDGKVRDLAVVSGPAELTAAAMQAAAKWVYQPTLINGEPVEVTTMVDLNFTLSGK
jgi:TonB family protein